MQLIVGIIIIAVVIYLAMLGGYALAYLGVGIVMSLDFMAYGLTCQEVARCNSL
jgi:hypothetical protein